MKKVLHLTYDMRIGGTEQVIKNLIEGSDKSQFEMSIYCLEQPTGPFGKMLIEQGIAVTGIQRRDGFDLNVIKQLRKHIKQHKIDILHCHQYTPWVYGTLAAIGTGSKVIFTEHGRFYPDRTSWKRKIINPVLLFFTNKITTISIATKKALIDYEYIPKNEIKVIYNGIKRLHVYGEKSIDLKHKLGITKNTYILGTIARLDPIKNQSMMLRAFKKVYETLSNTVLLVIGDGEEMENLKSLAMNLEISDKVIFTGYITNPTEYLELMEIFLLSSLSEGTSMTLLEAMSLAKPCVVTDAGGNVEIIKHQINGLVVQNKNEGAFAEAIIEILTDRKKHQQMSNEALSRFNNKFHVDYMVREFELIYQSL